MEETLELKQLPLGYISYSQIRMYKRCPWQYKLRYIDGLKMKPKSNLILGTGIHEGLTAGFSEKKNKGGSDKHIRQVIVDKAVNTIEELIKQEQEIEWSEGDDDAV
ncbi:MAG: PD-(D/E)XK nuclease family protein, partial [Thermodesulfovibrio sp.]|nr:PD-(D/E)XK nuclease family protein [Thermodesulfovibrio sp.]